MLIVEIPTVIVKCRTAVKAQFLPFNMSLCVVLDIHSCSFTSVSFLTDKKFFCFIMLHVPLIPYTERY